jgi:steroid 5-alpha reductase family enzyme
VSDFSTGPFLGGLAITAGAVLVLILGTWVLGRTLGRFNVIDVAWGLGFVVVAWVAYAVSAGHGDDTRRLLMAVLVTLWGGRLAGYIAWRSRGKGEDPRYADMLEGHADPARRALGIFLTQAVAIWFVSLPVQVAMFERDEPGLLLYVGTAVWAIGFFFESVGDWQLSRFRADPASQGQVMNHGLWRYTRHPNYFGDACTWWGIFLIAAERWPGVLTVVAPVIMTLLLTKGSGARILEKHMSGRDGWDEYAKRTSGFFPRPPTKA